MDDEIRLIEAARTDRRAFGELYDRHIDEIYHYVVRRVGSHEEAEDIVSATFERALGAIERYEIRGLPFLAWLYRIAGNLVANHHRRRAVRNDVEFESVSTASDFEPADRALERQAVRQAMARLSESDQEILSLCYFAGLSPPEIGAVLDCSTAAVHKRLHRARARLRPLVADLIDD